MCELQANRFGISGLSKKNRFTAMSQHCLVVVFKESSVWCLITSWWWWMATPAGSPHLTVAPQTLPLIRYMGWLGMVWYSIANMVRWGLVWYHTKVWYCIIPRFGIVPYQGLVLYHDTDWYCTIPRVLSRASDLPSCPPDWSPVNSNRSTPNSSFILILFFLAPILL